LKKVTLKKSAHLVDNESIEKKLHTLTEHARKPNEDLSVYLDSPAVIGALPPLRRLAYQKILSSIATVESTEEVILRPVAESVQKNAVLNAYLVTHANDEQLHADMVSHYVLKTLDYVKTKRSLTDRVIYDRILPRLADRAKDRPVSFALATYFLESMAEYVYRELKKSTIADGLTGLTKLIESIERDERRHLAGIECLI
jgi:ribonucleotide reductase beta subunit family protein with ferritin-like domain